MPSIEIIKASEAPGAPRKQSKFAAELLLAINSLKKDEVLKLTPDEGKSVRGLKTGIGRITKGEGIKVNTWDNGEDVFVARA
ncbi:MAG: hypothetical protein QM589_15350 [Thermomicrobiales bacterium]